MTTTLNYPNQIWRPTMMAAPAATASHSLFHGCDHGHFDSASAAAATTGVFLKMNVASICIPKDDERNPRGEDAHFISPELQTIGVADGVGGWRVKEGVDAGEYARQLMMNSVLALNRKSQGSAVNPKRIIEAAYNNTAAKGSSTACIISLSGNKLRAANVGDSGFLVIRDGNIIYKSPIQQRKFNCPYQLGQTRDNPSVAEEIEVAVKSGDVVVAGSDGLLDNVHTSEIVKIVRQGTTEGKDLVEQTCYMANVALYNSFDRYWDSPFSIASKEAGKRHKGGKVDDITVIIARIDQEYY